MPRYVVLLRAINVGGHNKILMADLRELLQELGMTDIATYIQSGNVVCSSRKKAPAVTSAIKTGIADRFGHNIDVMVRNADQIDAVVANLPFNDAEPTSSGVVFLANTYGGELDASAFAPDECQVSGADVYVICRAGFSNSKLTPAWIEKQTGIAGTRRNWATVLKLQEMLQA